MFQEIYVIDEHVELTEELKEKFIEHGNLKFKRISANDIQSILKNLPQLIIINDDTINIDSIELCKQIRTNEDNNIIPIIVVSSKQDKEFKMDLAKNYVEYYVDKKMGIEYLYYRIRNIFRLLVVNRTISPLTGLPGNVQIQTELKKRLLRKEKFTVLYLDLDNFKAYNDEYGFLKGDEIIKFTAKSILVNVNNTEKSNMFVGHIGGDDFVAIVSGINCEEACQNIIAEFDRNVVNYYSEEDAIRGYIEVENRKGIIEQFPIVSISVGVVEVNKNRFKNILEIGEAGAQVKHLAKTIPGSTYVIDKRSHLEQT